MPKGGHTVSVQAEARQLQLMALEPFLRRGAMQDLQATTTPDPEYTVPLGKKESEPAPLAGENPRGEVAGCPTGLANSEQAQQPQQPGGGGAPGTGNVLPAKSQPDYAPGEGISQQQQQSERKTS